MTTKVRIEWPRGAVTLVLEPTPTAAQLVGALPFTARAETWGEEVYFTTPVSAKLESSAKQVVPPGTVCFWVDGDARALASVRAGDSIRVTKQE